MKLQFPRVDTHGYVTWSILDREKAIPKSPPQRTMPTVEEFEPIGLYVSSKMTALIAESFSSRPPELLTPDSHLFLTDENVPWTGRLLTNTWRRLREIGP